MRYEGFVISPASEAIGRRFVAGELTLPDYIEAMLAISKADPDPRRWDEGQITAARIAQLHLDPVR